MIIQDKTIILKSGAKCVLRNACAKDAEQMIHYLKVSAAETEFILRYPDEVTYTIEEEEKILEDNKSSPYNFMAVAEVDGVIAGNCAINACGGKRKIRHRCSFGIALMKEYWGLGIGAALIELALEYAKKKLVITKLNLMFRQKMSVQLNCTKNMALKSVALVQMR